MAESKYPEDWESRRVAVIHREQGVCQECRQSVPQNQLHVHHDTPIGDGGSHRLDNLRLLCARCHADQHDVEVCAVCYLIGNYVMDEIKRHGSVGVAYLCSEHHNALAERMNTHAGVRAENGERCGFCLGTANGRYILADHATRDATVDVTMCSDCRMAVVNRERETLNERFIKGGGRVISDGGRS